MQNGRKNGIIILRFDRILEKNEEKGETERRIVLPEQKRAVGICVCP